MFHVTYLNMCWWNVKMWVTLQNPNFFLVSHPTTATLRLEYCRKKGISWIIEQPSSSLLPLYKPLEAGVGTEVPLLVLSKKIGSTSQQLALFICPDCFGLNLIPKTAIQQHPLQALMKRHQAKIYELPLGMMGANTEKHRCIMTYNAMYTLLLNNK